MGWVVKRLPSEGVQESASRDASGEIPLTIGEIPLIIGGIPLNMGETDSKCKECSNDSVSSHSREEGMKEWESCLGQAVTKP